jgi:hypothetical protein
MNVQMDPRRGTFQALHEQHQVVPAEEGAVIFGGVGLGQILPVCRLKRSGWGS